MPVNPLKPVRPAREVEKSRHVHFPNDCGTQRDGPGGIRAPPLRAAPGPGGAPIARGLQMLV